MWVSLKEKYKWYNERIIVTVIVFSKLIINKVYLLYTSIKKKIYLKKFQRSTKLITSSWVTQFLPAKKLSLGKSEVHHGQLSSRGLCSHLTGYNKRIKHVNNQMNGVWPAYSTFTNNFLLLICDKWAWQKKNVNPVSVILPCDIFMLFDSAYFHEVEGFHICFLR